MSDYIKREDAIKALESICVPRRVAVGVVAIDIDDAISELEQVPSADVVEVVRCKDCKHRHDSLLEGSPFPSFCDVFPAYISDNDFCSYGERVDT